MGVEIMFKFILRRVLLKSCRKSCRKGIKEIKYEIWGDFELYNSILNLDFWGFIVSRFGRIFFFVENWNFSFKV